MSSNKLHPIYVALDSHQYSRAVKLASALPPSNVLGRALLAHALQKSGSVVKALHVIRGILWFDSVELNYEIDRLSEGNSSDDQRASSTTSKRRQQQHQPPRSKKGGSKSGAKKRTVQEPTASSKSTSPQRILIQQLESTLVLPEGWDQVATIPEKQVITDETTLDTVAVTLQAVRLYTTVYQLYATTTPPTLQTLLKAYTTGLHIVALNAKYDNDIVSTALAGMQVIALQLARMSTEPDNDDDDNEDVVLKLWAAQTALWQLRHHSVCSSKNVDEKTRQRLGMLPRLAESLANKYKESSAEASLLYLETLKQQGKYVEIAEWLSSSLDTEQCPMTRQQRLEILASARETLEQWESAQDVYQELLQGRPEQWAYWMSLLRSSYRVHGVEGAIKAARAQLEKLADSDRPCRARHLVQCELAAVKIRGLNCTDGDDEASCQKSNEDLEGLQDAIVSYGTVFAPRALCTYSDLVPYIELFVDVSNSEAMDSFLEWASQMRSKNKSVTDRAMLRSNTFAIQVTYKVLSMLKKDSMNNKWLPKWEDLVSEWRASRELGIATEGQNAQKENQPGDELVLLAVQNILFRNDEDTSHLLAAASLLEEALQYSPDNAYLKISAIYVYSELNASHRSWELFQALSVKHIQLDSCSFLILPRLVEGGLYNEAITHSNELLKFHASIARDTGDYSGQAMEHGTLSKANEFLVFQHDCMNGSLALLDSKALIMNCAPLLHNHSKTQGLGMQHGIVGKDTDLERVNNMIREIHNPFAAPNVMTRAAMDVDKLDMVPDNRDFSILSYQVVNWSTPTGKDQTVLISIRSGLLHGLLLRVALCLDATMAPRKGKVTKPSDLLQYQCMSLMDAVDQTAVFVERSNDTSDNKNIMHAMLILCRVIAHVSSGVPLTSQAAAEDDTLSTREQCATRQLDAIVIPTMMTWSVPRVCRFLPELLVPLTAMLRMTANMFALYGWGKRKRCTRSSAGSLARLAKDTKAVVESMRTEMTSLPDNEGDCSDDANEFFESVVAEINWLDEASARNVCHIVPLGQQLTRHRVVPFLDEILVELVSYEV